MTAPAFERVRDAAPAGVEVVAIDDELDLRTVDFLVPSSFERGVMEALPELTRVEVVQVLSAGTDRIEGSMPPQATLCNARGARDGPVAEWIVAALLGASSRTLECAGLTSWSDREVEDLESWTVLIVGMGSIGRHVARLLEPFGTRVVGVASRAREDLHGVDELPALLPDADAVVLLTPLTDPEPLPDGHPLWTAPGVLSITPHIAGDSELAHRRAVDLAARQLVRWARGEELENVVRAGRLPNGG